VGPRIDRDFHLPYRDAGEFDRWARRDAVALLRDHLLAAGADAARIQALEHDAESQLRASIERARRAPLPAPSSLEEHLYS
jgi:2-oxoisovalerate dehydrogenase E1 component